MPVKNACMQQMNRKFWHAARTFAPYYGASQLVTPVIIFTSYQDKNKGWFQLEGDVEFQMQVSPNTSQQVTMNAFYPSKLQDKAVHSTGAIANSLHSDTSRVTGRALLLSSNIKSNNKFTW
jgi:hypothetical protein